MMRYVILPSGIKYITEDLVPPIEQAALLPEQPEIPLAEAIKSVEAIAAKQRAALESELIPNG